MSMEVRIAGQSWIGAAKPMATLLVYLCMMMDGRRGLVDIDELDLILWTWYDG